MFTSIPTKHNRKHFIEKENNKKKKKKTFWKRNKITRVELFQGVSIYQINYKIHRWDHQRNSMVCWLKESNHHLWCFENRVIRKIAQSCPRHCMSWDSFLEYLRKRDSKLPTITIRPKILRQFFIYTSKRRLQAMKLTNRQKNNFDSQIHEEKYTEKNKVTKNKYYE